MTISIEKYRKVVGELAVAYKIIEQKDKQIKFLEKQTKILNEEVYRLEVEKGIV